MPADVAAWRGRARTAATRSRTTRVLEAFGRTSLVALELETGRQHQIRAHLEYLGHPLVGERVYAEGARSSIKARRQMLHAWKLSFPHPLRRTDDCGRS